MATQLLIWIGFSVFVLAMLTLDLGLFQRKAHAVGMKEALTWSAVWIGLALLFNSFGFTTFSPERRRTFC